MVVTATAAQRYAIGNEVHTSPDARHDWLPLGPWKVGWLGGWTRDRLAYLVMVVRVVDDRSHAKGTRQ